MKRKRKLSAGPKGGGCLILCGAAVLLAAVGFIGWMLFIKLDGGPPRIVLDEDLAAIRADQILTARVSDAGSGLSKIHIRLEKAGRVATLAEKKFPTPFIGRSGAVMEDVFKTTISPRELGLTDGRAVLTISATDASWRRWFQGNRAVLEKSVLIDTRSPDIRVLTRSHNLVSGGAGLVIYTLSEDCPEHGVVIDGDWYPGQPAGDVFGTDSHSVFMAFIALAHDKGPEVKMHIKARDAAGNQAMVGLARYIRQGRFKDDVITISDRFLQWKLPEFDSMIPASVEKDPLKRFIWVNRHLRKASYAEIARYTQTSDPKIYWEGTFLRLPGSARQASFADHREYRWKDQVIDHQVHKGIDLASFKHAQVPAANHGRVTYKGDIGIYGGTVVIDHGFGLFSTYSHLSRMDVEKGQMVRKGDVVGRTGVSGLAGGDHLHFGIMVRSTFVNPVEWWDNGWIQNNVLDKISEAKSELQYLN